MNPYLAGLMLGVVLLAAFYVTGRGLGASGAMKSVVVSAVATVAPDYAESSHYYSKYIAGGKNPMKSWLVFEMLGVLVGGFISGSISGRLKLKVENHPASPTASGYGWPSSGVCCSGSDRSSAGDVRAGRRSVVWR